VFEVFFDADKPKFSFLTSLHDVIIILICTGKSGNVTVSRNGKETAVLTSEDHYSFNEQHLIRFSRHFYFILLTQIKHSKIKFDDVLIQRGVYIRLRLWMNQFWNTLRSQFVRHFELG
jgi:hypothetical protein